MSAYIPDPTDVTQPVGSVAAGTAAAEFRALKAWIALLSGLSSTPVGISSINGGQLAGLRNKILNGKMEIAQRGTSLGGIPNNTYLLDRWIYTANGAIVGTLSQQADVPSSNEFQFSQRHAVTTADAAIAAGDWCMVSQRIEGYNVRDLIGRTFTLGFWVRGAKTGVHNVAFRNQGNDRSYICEYTINAINTWEYKSVVVTGGLITAGSWNWTTAQGLYVDFPLYVGSTFHTAKDAWQVGNFFGTAAAVQTEGDTIGNVFAFTGVQLEIGNIATAFEHRNFAADLAMCQRYYEKSFALGTTPAAAAGLVPSGAIRAIARSVGATSQFLCPTPFVVRKRAVPTVVCYSPIIAGNQPYDNSAAGACSAFAAAASEWGLGTPSCTGNAGTTVGGALDYAWTADAEL